MVGERRDRVELGGPIGEWWVSIVGSRIKTVLDVYAIVDVGLLDRQRGWYKVHMRAHNGQRPLVGEAMEGLWSFEVL